MTQSGYFRLATTVALGIGIADGELIFCHGVSQKSENKTISTKYYNIRAIYDCFNNHFTANFGIPAPNLPQITIDDRPRLHKRARNTPDLLPVAISFTSENSASTLTTPSNSKQLFILPSVDTNPPHAIMRDEP